MSQEKVFSKLQQLINPVGELNQQKAAIEKKEAELKEKTDERGESFLFIIGSLGFIVFPVLSFTLSKWVIPDGIVSLLCSIPVVSFVTKILFWQANGM